MSTSMTNDIKFTYDASKFKLTIKDGDEVKVFNLSEDRSQIFYYILKAIDLLDDSPSTSNVEEWAKKGSSELIPSSKLDTSGESGSVVTVGENGVINPDLIYGSSSEVESSDDSTLYTFVGGEA